MKAVGSYYKRADCIFGFIAVNVLLGPYTPHYWEGMSFNSKGNDLCSRNYMAGSNQFGEFIGRCLCAKAQRLL